MDFQETEEAGGLDTGTGTGDAVNLLSKLRLTSFSSAAAADAVVPSVDQCNPCGGAMKRPTPSSSSPLQPNSKKITLHPSSGHRLRGFTKIPLPPYSPMVWDSTTPPPPTLRRSASDPINSPGNEISGPAGSILNPFSPENAKINNTSAVTQSPAKATFSPQALRRSVSDPNSSADRRYKRMKDRMKEMNQWWTEVLRAEEEEDEEDGGSGVAVGGAAKDESETENEEAVSVERAGNCLIIHIKCPCGKGYQILLSGRNCYYKLM
ncbi:uncharacterized protein LOC127786847 [Diospyros lotus]|uniref:uncharacterized protein LOC127786847 n=1 Tax=Diospyros lotus TaxID=55363 RepID=UPI00225C12AA|nr:uncharacterized protein LOC127786847 [Diospyros lotus]